MDGRNATAALRHMADSDNGVLMLATERFEGRLAEENGKLRTEMATEFGKVRTEMAAEFGTVRTEMASLRATMEAGFGALRAEMIDRNGAMLRWLLFFGVSQTAALVGVLQLWR